MKIVRAVAAVALGLLAGCETTSSGTYLDVIATLDDDSCGTGAVDAPDSWTFQVRVDPDDDTIEWYDVDEQESLTGTIEDGELLISTSDDVVVTDPSSSDPGCSVRRRDRYTGTIDVTGTTVSRIEGEISLTYSQTTGYDCEDLVGDSEGFDELPCEVQYVFVATPSSE